MTEKRFADNLEAPKGLGFVNEGTQTAQVPPAQVPPALFTLKLQSPVNVRQGWQVLLNWLLQHPIVSFDPGQRWIVSGIIARLVSSEVISNNETDSTVKLSFAFRKLRISGRKWMAYKSADDDVVEDFIPQAEQQDAAAKVQSLLAGLADSTFLLATPEAQLVQLQSLYADHVSAADAGSVKDRLDAAMVDILDRKRILRTESRLLHQKRLSLMFVRKIDSLCADYGDPIIIFGAAGGGGGRGRAQVKHDLLLNTLAGFFSVVMLNEHNTSKKTTCCHRDAHAPRSAGRSRGCRHCCKAGKQTAWWDRDTGAAWNLLSVFLSLLLTGQRPQAMTKAAKTRQQ